MQNLEQCILARRREVDSVRVACGAASVRLLGGLSHNHTSYRESFVCRKLFPGMREKPHEITALVMMRTNWTPVPHLDRMAKENHPAGGRFRTLHTKFVKHISYIAEWKRCRVLIVEQVIDSSVTVAVGKHDANKVAGCKVSEPTVPRGRDLIQ
jgi:hypothetical protein